MPGAYQGTGAAFVSAFKQAFGHQPQPQAVFGYAAVQSAARRAQEGRRQRR